MATKGTKGAEVKSDEDGTVPGDYFTNPFVENPLVIILQYFGYATASWQTSDRVHYWRRGAMDPERTVERIGTLATDFDLGLIPFHSNAIKLVPEGLI